MSEFLRARVGAIRRVADTVIAISLDSAAGEALPAYEPGAHVDVRLPCGLLRSYSLFTRHAGGTRYEIAVNRDRHSRGGSGYLHDHLKVGDELEVSAPRNLFGLAGGPHPSVLVAGGIGITPLYCMAQHLAAQGAPWHLAYAARSREAAAFVRELGALARGVGATLETHFDDEAGGQALDIARIIDQAPTDAHFYCCGPAPMLEAYLKACERLPPDRVHYERFAGQAPETAGDAGFEVELARSGMTLQVKPDGTILDAMLDAGIDIEYSCMQGICGSCRTAVIAGQPDHRDAFLTPREQAANDTIMVCCSRARGRKLVLDK